MGLHLVLLPLLKSLQIGLATKSNYYYLFDNFSDKILFSSLLRFHQVRSYDRNIAVNLWWKYTPGFVPEDCDGVEQNQTLDKVTFTSLENDMEESEITVL